MTARHLTGEPFQVVGNRRTFLCGLALGTLALSILAGPSVVEEQWQGNNKGPVMPHYEFYCEKCEKDVTLALISWKNTRESRRTIF